MGMGAHIKKSLFSNLVLMPMVFIYTYVCVCVCAHACSLKETLLMYSKAIQ